MERFFNTAGPMILEHHYHVSPLARVDLGNILQLIEQRRYFVLHAPRQTGKTSTLLALMDRLNGDGRYRCVYVNVELGQSARQDVDQAMRAILGALEIRAQIALGDTTVGRLWPEAMDTVGPHGALQIVLSRWCLADERPLVVLVDEVDALGGDTLLAVLRQLRSGYDQRPRGFPQSVVLCGVRDVRDYRIRSLAENVVVAGGSAFNIKAESLRLGDFSPDEVRTLLAQHTGDTGQAFDDDALDEVWTLTRGQPWLVNALGHQACFRDATGRERTRPIDVEAVHAAREQLVARRETHLDQLADTLREDRVRRVVEPLLSGSRSATSIPEDDVQYVRDLGLIRAEGDVEIANPIYREVVPRALTYTTQLMTFGDDPARYVGDDGRLRVVELLAAFQMFFREHSEHWVERFDYKEAGPQLLLQAFLQRIVNSGGRVEREYGLGRMRTDLLVIWPVAGEPARRIVIECKLRRGDLDRTVRLGVDQTRAYMDRCAADEGHLVVFDREEARSWDDKVFRREYDEGGASVLVWGM